MVWEGSIPHFKVFRRPLLEAIVEAGLERVRVVGHRLSLLFVLWGVLFGGTVASGDATVEAVTSVGLSAPEMDSLREYLEVTGRSLLRGEGAMALATELGAVRQLVEDQVIPSDGNRKIHLVVVDDLRPDAVFLGLPGGDRALVVNLGLIRFVENDDELRFVTGHELSHGVSEIQAEIDRIKQRDPDSPLWHGLRRSVENEVDVRSVVERVHRKGGNPYGGVHFLQRLRTSGLVPDATIQSRIDTVSMAITGLKRQLGEGVKADLPDAFTAQLVEAFKRKLLSTAQFEAGRLRAVEHYLTTLTAPEARAAYQRVAEWKLASAQRSNPYPTAYENHWNEIERLGFGLFNQQGRVRLRQALHARLDAEYEKARSEVLGQNFAPKSGRQLNQLRSLDNRSYSLIDLNAIELTHELRRAETAAQDSFDLAKSAAGAEERMEHESKALHARRQIQGLKVRLEAALTAYDLPAEQMNALIERAREHDYTGDSQRDSARQRVLDHLRSVGPALRRNLARDVATRRENIEMLLNPTPQIVEFFTNVQAVATLPELDLRPLAGRILEGLYESSRLVLVAATTPESSQRALWQIGSAWNDPEKSAVHHALLEERLREPGRTAERLGEHFLAILQRASSMEQFSELMSHEEMDREGALVRSVPRGVFVDPELSKELFLLPQFREGYLAALNGLLEKEVGAVATFDDANASIDRHAGILSGLRSRGFIEDAHLNSVVFTESLSKVRAVLVRKARVQLSTGLAKPIAVRMARSFVVASHPVFCTLPGAPDVDRAAVKADLVAIAQDPAVAINAHWSLSFPALRRLVFPEGRSDISHAFLESIAAIIDYNRHHQGVEAPAGFTKEQIAEEAAAWGDWLRSRGNGAQNVAAWVFDPDVRIGPDSNSAEYKHFVTSSDAFLNEVFESNMKKHAALSYRAQVAAATYDTWLTVANWSNYWVDGVIRSWYPDDVQGQMEFFLGYQAGMRRYLSDAKRTALGQPSPVPHYDDAVRRAKAMSEIESQAGSELRGFELRALSGRYYTGPIDEFFKHDGDYRKVAPLTLLDVWRARGATAENDEIFEYLWKLKDTNPTLRLGLLDEGVVRTVHYSENQELLARWQLEEKFGLTQLQKDLLANRAQRPERQGVRDVVTQVCNTIERQFPERSGTRDDVLSNAQDHLLSNADETRLMDGLRLSADNWFEHRALLAVDAPQWLSNIAQTSFDKLEIIRYLTGQTDEVPKFAAERVVAMAARGQKPLDWIERGREAFRQAPRHVRTYILMPYLDSEQGVLSDPAVTEEAYKMVVGDALGDPVVGALFEAYNGNLPKSEQQVLLAHVLGTLVERRSVRPSIQKGLRASCVALGLDAERFIDQAGLVSDDVNREVEYYLRRLSAHAELLAGLERANFWSNVADRVHSSPHGGTKALIRAVDGHDALKDAIRSNVLYGEHLEAKMDRFGDALRRWLATLPAAERGRRLAAMAASVTLIQRGEQAPVRSILEAMGPFGIKAGQFLRSSGLVGPEIRKQLDSFFDDALRPIRSEIINKVQKMFGEGLGPVEFLGHTVGSGSINFAVLAEVKNPRTGVVETLVLRFRRDGTVGRIANENAVWEQAIVSLKANRNRTVARLGDVLDQVRRHSMETLGPGGAEMDHRIEPSYHSTVRRAYEKGPDPLTGYRIEVAQPNADLMAIVPEEFKDQMSAFFYVPNTRLKKLSASEQQRFSAQIFGSELQAMLGLGVFDPDGHPGNWLIDTQNKRLVRIDYPQLREYGPQAMKPFAEILRTLLLPGASRGIVDTVFLHFGEVYDIQGPYGPNLKEAVRQAVLAQDFPAFYLPHERLFHIQDRVQKYFDARGMGVTISLKPTTRSALGALSRMAIYREFMGDSTYLNVLSNQLRTSPTTIRVAAVAHGVLGRTPVGEKVYGLLLDGCHEVLSVLGGN